MKVNYSKELMEEAVKNSVSIAQVCNYIGLKPIGGNYKTIKAKIALYNLDTSHFTGQRWNAGLSLIDKTCHLKLEDILKDGINYSSDLLRKRLINAELKQNICEQCGLSGEEINLELHHINGNHFDNRLENLQILCPNCHSKTDNFRNRGQSNINEGKHLYKKQDHMRICENCGKEFYSDRLDKPRRFCCRECYSEFISKFGSLNDTFNVSLNNMNRKELKEYCDKYNNISEIANALGTSRPTVKKYLEKFNLLEEFKSKYDFKAIPVLQCDMSGNIIKEWPSQTDAGDSLGICSRDISACVNHRRRSAGGFIWKLKE